MNNTVKLIKDLEDLAAPLQSKSMVIKISWFILPEDINQKLSIKLPK